MKGAHVTITRWTEAHAGGLWKNFKSDPALLAYTPAPDFRSEEDVHQEFDRFQDSDDPIIYAVLGDPRHLSPAPGGGESDAVSHTEVLGLVLYASIGLASRVIEIGALLSPALQRTAAATEIHLLLLSGVLDQASPVLGGSSPPFRRVTWKCNSLNVKSKASALRAGYVFEGTTRSASIQKGRSRDDAVFSMLDSEWPLNRAAMQTWLSRDNWDAEGKQSRKLEVIRSELVEKSAQYS